MNGRYLLDTNIVVPFLNGETGLKDKLGQYEDIYLPVFVLGELYYGAFNSSKKTYNLEKIEEFKEEIFILDCDEHTTKIYGEVKKGLKNKGTPIPENDIWISAIAIQYNLTLVTRDSHFYNVDGLSIERW
ncbi:MAG: type II toxin-antitoxin system VapC family toxin [Saprospiraceae bacterium]|jgi:tRNA(fMet)-specific endonuclease VapC|nr:type II toxin-antitoxin system VapC family toxin [Saprospiraceae bacterium]